MSRKKLVVLAVALFLVLPIVATAAPLARGLAGGENPASFLAAAWQWFSGQWAFGLPKPAGLDGPKAAWEKEGSAIDPNGGKKTSQSPAAAGGAIDPDAGTR